MPRRRDIITRETVGNALAAHLGYGGVGDMMRFCDHLYSPLSIGETLKVHIREGHTRDEIYRSLGLLFHGFFREMMNMFYPEDNPYMLRIFRTKDGGGFQQQKVADLLKQIDDVLRDDSKYKPPLANMFKELGLGDIATYQCPKQGPRKSGHG